MKNQQIVRILAILAVFFAFTAFMLPLQEDSNYHGEKFTKLGIAVKGRVNIEQGNTYKVDIQADDKTRENIKLELSGDELQIGSKHGAKISDDLVINITVETLNAVSVAGSSNVYIDKTFTTDKMDLSIAGSGNLKVTDLKTDKVSGSIAGSGNLVLAGGQTESDVDISIAGSGNVDASGFTGATGDVEIAGSGDCRINVSEKLTASIAGSGSVLYKGNPLVKSETAGSGKVRPMDE
jgi:hypothetical protein